jgi:hypothetical protein
MNSIKITQNNLKMGINTYFIVRINCRTFTLSGKR